MIDAEVKIEALCQLIIRRICLTNLRIGEPCSRESPDARLSRKYGASFSRSIPLDANAAISKRKREISVACGFKSTPKIASRAR